MIKQLSPEEAANLIANSAVTVKIIDARDAENFASGHIKGAERLSLLDMKKFCLENNKNQPILVYCYYGVSSQVVAQYLQDQGFLAVYSLDGGYEQWQAYHHPTSDQQTE